jgi:hypothetical protein
VFLVFCGSACLRSRDTEEMRFQGLNVTNYASLVMMGDYGKSIKDLALARIPAVSERGF